MSSADSAHSAADRLPDYAERLRLQHEAFGQRWTEAIAAIAPVLDAGAAVADLACGDGFFSRALQQSQAAQCRVTGFDSDDDYLAAAGELTRQAGVGGIEFVKADVLNLGGGDDQFDLVFCGDSFQSIPRHDQLIGEMKRVCRPGGCVMVTETDGIHDVIGSWPPEIDVMLRAAEIAKLSGAARRGYSFPRYAIDRFRAAGLTDVRQRSWTTDACGPIDGKVRRWLDRHLSDRLEAIDASLSAADTEQLYRHLHPDGRHYFGNDPDATLTFVRYFVVGTS